MVYLPHHKRQNHAAILGNDFESPPIRMRRCKITFKYQKNEWKTDYSAKLHSCQAVNRKHLLQTLHKCVELNGAFLIR